MISTPLFRLSARRRSAGSHKALLWVEALETRFCPSGTPTAMEAISPVTLEPEKQAVEMPAAQEQQPAAVIAVDTRAALPAALPAPAAAPVAVITPDAAAAVFAAAPVASTPTMAPVAVGELVQAVAMEQEEGGGGSFCLVEEEGFAITQFTAQQNSESSWTLRGHVVNAPTLGGPIEVVFGGMEEFQGRSTVADENGDFEFTITLPGNINGTVSAQATNGSEMTTPVLTTIGGNPE